MTSKAQQLGYHDVNSDGPFDITSDTFGDSTEPATRRELEEIVTMWEQDTDEEFTGFLLETGGELRYYRSDTPGDYEIVGTR